MEQAHVTNPGLVANLVSRIILAFASIMVSWVPFRLLVRNGEFAAVVFIADVAMLNLITIVNSVIWHDDDWTGWWDGAGLCDIEVYITTPLQTIYAASIFTIMYHLAQQVKVTRAARGRRERTRRNLIQAAIIFPVPFVQLVFTWFDLAQRYIIGTLIGCSAVYDASWPKILVYDAPPAVFALLAVPYAVLVWKRYHAIKKQGQGVLNSDGEVSIRSNRTRRRLYNMSLSILVVYVPVMMYFLICNIQDTLSSYRAYNYHRMHWSATPYPWETILFVPSWIIPSDIMNQPWISIATAVVILAFFGMTIEAQQMYCQYAEYLGLDKYFQNLKRKKDQAPNPGDGIGRTHRVRNSIEYHLFSRGRDSIIPTIERPDIALTTEAQPRAPLPSRTAINTPPVIPPRYSSLRSSFAFRTPTLQSIRKSNRFRLLRTRATRNISASGASSKTTGGRTELYRNDSALMLPLHGVSRGVRKAFSSFLVRDEPEGISRRGRNRRGFRVRVPITSAFDGRRAEYAEMVRIRGAPERETFPREQTLASLYTASDNTRTSGSQSSAARDAGSEIGVAK